MWPAGALALALPRLLAHPFFDTRLTNWLGLVTHKPVTEDWVPVLPWLGVMLWGVAAGHALRLRRPQWLYGAVPHWTQPLRWLGQRPLRVYMLHQPLLIGALMAAAAWRH
jgi:uncharacterized membrane protein